MRVADYVMQRLYEEGCHHLFTVTGRGILYLTDALAKETRIKSVCVHHEQSASYAAMSYAQYNGKIGGALVSTGCGSTNAITGVLCAWQDDVPCIIISGQNKLEETTRYTNLPIRTYGQQEADIVGIVKPITKYATMLIKAQDIAYEMDKAIYLAKSGRKGPVWIDIPLDVQNMRVDPQTMKRFVPEEQKTKTASLEDISDVIQSLKNAKRPIVLIGSGIRSAGAIDEIHSFIKKHDLPAVYANSATDILDPTAVLSVGCVGAMASNRAANFAIQNCDFLLVLGCRMSTILTGQHVCKFAREAKIIAVDIDEYEHQKFPNKIDNIIICDVKEFLDCIIKEDAIKTSDVWIKKCQHWKDTFPKCEEMYKKSEEVDLYHLAEFLTKYLADDGICITDSGLQELITPTTVEFKKNQRAIHPPSQGAMGYALPATIGAYYSSGKQIVAVIGDGSIMMNLQEFETIKYHQIPVKILVINNDCYAVIRKRQKDLFRTRTIGTDKDNGVSCPDFEKIAQCFGLNYERINTSSELDKLEKILKDDGPVLCEIMAKPDQEYIHSSYKLGENRRFVQPPIEDQSPFLDRKIFLEEMIIEPIDQ